MSTINPREVLTYLNDLGYTNITAYQLKEFIKDLKKLIKYEQKQERNNYTENNSLLKENDIQNDIFTRLYSDSTFASKAKEVSKKESVISVEIKKPRKPHNYCRKCDHTPLENDLTEDVKFDSIKEEKVCHQAVQVSTDKLTRPASHSQGSEKTSCKAQMKENMKPKVSFIRPQAKVKSCKSDPVALYHQYQAEWKKQKFPGEDHRSNLRWAIREKMLSGPRVISAAPSMETIARKRQNSNRI